MRPPLWHPPVEPSTAEKAVMNRVRRAKLFVFLRQYRHELCSDAFQQELATLYKDSPQGQPPVPPAQLALATILQAYSGVSDDEVIEATIMDRRWQLVLDCLDGETPPFSKGTLVAFRQRLIDMQMDRRLVERTLEIAAASEAFGPRQLRAALDSSPLWGAGRVEDTYNLMGHALRKALGVLARQQGRGLPELAREAGAPLVGGSSIKACLDLNWDEPGAHTQALSMILDALTKIEHWLDTHPDLVAADPRVTESIAVAHQVRMQDVTTTADGMATLRQGVAQERRISVEDAQMRYGRKSRSLLVDGYKRHILRDLESGLVVAVGITPANAPEAHVTEAIEQDLAAQQATLKELHIDRAYLASSLVEKRSEELAIFCKAWPVRSGPYFPKNAFELNWQNKQVRCPGGVSMPFELGGVVTFPKETCAGCSLRDRCTQSVSGRHIKIHPDEALLQELRERQQTPQGRAKLRERVAVEHGLSHIGRWQGRRARYCGVRKNVCDLRRCAVVHNLHVLQRLQVMALQEAA